MTRLLCGICLASVTIVASVASAEVDGFTEPYHIVNVGATEVGIVTEMKVREGDRVTKGQVLATLDQDVHLALLAIAAANMDTKGRIDSAKAELELRRVKLAKLEKLGSRGHARQEEVERARADVAIAEANVRAVEEELLIRRLEYDKIDAQNRRRTIRAPIGGIVAQIHKEVGEPIAPNDPQILMLVQLTTLRATFSVPSEDTVHLQVESPVTIRFAGSDTRAEGVVEFVSPTIDAESGTVRVKVRIDNPSERYRSGARCSMVIPTPYQDVAANK